MPIVIIRLLSHAKLCSFTAFKCLQQETLDPTFLARLLEPLSRSIKDTIGLSTFLTVSLQQARREAAIHSAPRTEESKKKLRKIQISAKHLFVDKIEEIYKENVANVETNRSTLVDKVAGWAKSQGGQSRSDSSVKVCTVLFLFFSKAEAK